MAKVKVLSPAFLFVLAGIAFFGCSDFGQIPPQNDNQNQNTGDNGEVNILTSVFPSPKEENPYSVENMNETFEDFILANNPNATDIPELEPNFLYVRFLPYGKQAEYELKTYDDALVLFKHPMDYNDIRKPVVYVDESLPDSVTPYFAVVPVGYEFGPTPYEILQELFLTQPLEEDEEAARRLKIRVQGDKPIYLHTSFGGFIVAPNAYVVVGQAEKEYAGQIYANSITLHQYTRFLWVVPD